MKTNILDKMITVDSKLLKIAMLVKIVAGTVAGFTFLAHIEWIPEVAIGIAIIFDGAVNIFGRSVNISTGVGGRPNDRNEK